MHSSEINKSRRPVGVIHSRTPSPETNMPVAVKNNLSLPSQNSDSIDDFESIDPLSPNEEQRALHQQKLSEKGAVNPQQKEYDAIKAKHITTERLQKFTDGFASAVNSEASKNTISNAIGFISQTIGEDRQYEDASFTTLVQKFTEIHQTVTELIGTLEEKSRPKLFSSLISNAAKAKDKAQRSSPK